jgi:hypothetical protein
VKRLVVLAMLAAAALVAVLVSAAHTARPNAAVEAFEAADPLLKDAADALAAKDWDAAVAANTKALAALGDEPVLGGWRDQANYNTACALAHSGNTAAAAEAFAASIRDGLRPVVFPGPAGTWIPQPDLTLEHVLADADLDPIRKEKVYTDALAPYLAAGDPVIELTQKDESPPVPAVIVLAAENDDAEHALTAWRAAAKDRRIALVALAGPVRPTPKERHWILRDGDERWAVAKIRATLDVLAKDARIDGKRVFLVGAGERPGEAAWAAALAEPSRFAGLAALGARFHAAWHADAIATAPKEWRVAVGVADDVPAKMLKERGIEAARVGKGDDESKTVAAVLAAFLDAH